MTKSFIDNFHDGKVATSKGSTPADMNVDDIVERAIARGVNAAEHIIEDKDEFNRIFLFGKNEAKTSLAKLFSDGMEKVIGPDTTGVSLQTEALNMLRELQRSRITEVLKEIGL